MIIVLLFSSAVHAEDILFDNGKTLYTNITINYSQITGISFNITRDYYNGSYPNNISIDIADNGYSEWKFNIYHSNISETASSVLTAFSYFPDSTEIHFLNDMNESFDGLSMGNIKNNIFSKNNDYPESNIGIGIAESISAQIISITTNDTTIHAVLPDMNVLMDVGLYLAKGGSTYYCNSDHDFTVNRGCNMTIAEAMTNTHLARNSSYDFRTVEPISNPRIIDSINDYLSSCSLPCEVPVRIDSGLAGNISFSDIDIIPMSSGPATITMIENSTHYNIQITPNLELTSTGYFYGDMPNIYIIPVIADNDAFNLSANQTKRLNMINNSLPSYWDNLTNNSHPLNFTIYTDPFLLYNFNTGENFSIFETEIVDTVIPTLNMQDPAILVILDLKDYFPTHEPYNVVRSPGADTIGEIYINGFDDSNPKTQLFNYDNEILLNIISHEIGHTFIGYPVPDSNKYFLPEHPGAFTDIPDFNTYNASQSPTGNEGYYEVYSIMNVPRIYASTQDFNNKPAVFTEFDKSLIGILSPYYLSDYIFYDGNITNIGNRYVATQMTPQSSVDAQVLYQSSTDDMWWDIRSYSNLTNMGTLDTFSVERSIQDNKALWVYAEDAGYPGHYQVFPNNAGSIAIESNFTTCIPDVVNSSWSAWINLTNCTNGTMTLERYRDEFDNNSCGPDLDYRHYEYDSYNCSCIHEADSDCSGDISNLELAGYANRWYVNSSDVSSIDLATAATIWYNG